MVVVVVAVVVVAPDRKPLSIKILLISPLSKDTVLSRQREVSLREVRVRPFVLQWHITERCNLHCRHCYQEPTPAQELSFDNLLLILEQFKEFINRLRKEMARPSLRGHINVTGGEPFIREDFFDLLQVFDENKEHFSFGILTNGTLIDDSIARRLSDLSPTSVQVSMEGSASINDAIRGQGVFENTVSALKHLIRENVPTTISFTASEANSREFEEVAHVARNLGVRQVWADRLIPCGGGSDMRVQVMSPKETREFFETMYSARRETERTFSKTAISMHRALQFLVGGEKPYRCGAGEYIVTVQPNGDLYPCRRLPIRVGNLMEASLSELYDTSDLFRALRAHRVSEGCEACCFTSQCRGGLRCLAYAMTGDPFWADPGCWRVNRDADGQPVATSVSESQLQESM